MSYRGNTKKDIVQVCSAITACLFERLVAKVNYQANNKRRKNMNDTETSGKKIKLSNDILIHTK